MSFELMWKNAERLGLYKDGHLTVEGMLFLENHIRVPTTHRGELISLLSLLHRFRPAEHAALALIHRLRFPPDESKGLPDCMLSACQVSDLGDRHDWQFRWYWGGLRSDVIARSLCLAGVLTSNAWKYE